MVGVAPALLLMSPEPGLTGERQLALVIAVPTMNMVPSRFVTAGPVRVRADGQNSLMAVSQ